MRYDQEWTIFCSWLGARRERRAKIPKEKSSDKVTYGILSDTHIPFQDQEAVADATDWLRSRGASRLVVAGDILDCYCLSRFVTYDKLPIQEEFIEARKVLDFWSRSFSSIWLLEGNHESRERKYLASHVPPELYDWFYREGILTRLSTDMPNVSIVRRSVAEHSLHWIAQIGRDAIAGHPEKFSSIPLRPVDNFRRWITEWHDVVSICQPRLVLCGHTHQAGIYAGHEFVVETGCLCRPQGYALEPRLYSKPQRHAATVFTQVGGRTDLNSLRQYYPGANRESRPKPPDIG